MTRGAIVLIAIFAKSIGADILGNLSAVSLYKCNFCDAMLSAVYAVFVCVCVCLSHSGIVSKRLNVGSRK